MILHLDMDAFFASVEQLDNPALRGKPVIIGVSQRGVVSTASYEARVYGIHSAMPVATARKLCPHGIFLPGRFRRYMEISDQVILIMREYSPIVQKASIDEAYLDIGGLSHSDGELGIAREISIKVRHVTGGLTCSIGVAPVKFLAKICSDVNKPDGIFILRPHDVADFLENMPVGKLPGVGRRMRASLESFGVTRVGQLKRLSRDFLLARYGKWGAVLHERAHGLDPRMVHENLPAKSEGSERTFIRDVSDKNELRDALARHAERISASLRKTGMAGRTCTLKIKYADFQQITRSRTLPYHVNSQEAIFKIARDLLDSVELARPVRLIGISMSGFDVHAEQLFLPGIQGPFV